MQPYITFRNIPPSLAIEHRILENTQSLQRHYDRITFCRVTVESQAQKTRHKSSYQVRIDVLVPGGEVVVSQEAPEHHSNDLYGTLRDAFDAAERQLDALAAKRHRH